MEKRQLVKWGETRLIGQRTGDFSRGLHAHVLAQLAKRSYARDMPSLHQEVIAFRSAPPSEIIPSELIASLVSHLFSGGGGAWLKTRFIIMVYGDPQTAIRHNQF